MDKIDKILNIDNSPQIQEVKEAMKKAKDKRMYSRES